MREMFGGHPYAIVGKGETEMVGRELFSRDAEEGGPLSISESVVEEIAEQRLYELWVALHGDALGHTYLDAYTTLEEEGRHLFVELMEEGSGMNSSDLGREGRVVKTGEHGHITQQMAQTDALAITLLYEIGSLLLDHRGMVDEGLKVTLDGGGRGLQLMGSILGELVFDALFLVFTPSQSVVHHTHDDDEKEDAKGVIKEGVVVFET